MTAKKVDIPCIDCGSMMYQVHPALLRCDACRKKRIREHKQASVHEDSEAVRDLCLRCKRVSCSKGMCDAVAEQKVREHAD